MRAVSVSIKVAPALTSTVCCTCPISSFTSMRRTSRPDSSMSRTTNS